MKRNFRLFLTLFTVLMLGAVLANLVGLHPVIGALAVTALSFLPQAKGALNAQSVSVADLATALGDYFRGDTNKIYKEMLLGMDIGDRFDIMDGVKDEMPLPNLSISDIVKPADPNNFNPPTGAIAFGARKLKVRGAKVDLKLVPQELYKTWLGKMYAKGSNPLDMPLQDFIKDYVREKVQENLRMQVLYKGVYNAVGTTPGAVANGLLKLVTDEITATNISPIATGALTAANIIDKVEAVYEGIGDAYKNKPLVMHAAPTLVTWYGKKYRELYGANNNYGGVNNNSMKLDFGNVSLVAEPGMTGSQRLICTTPDNPTIGVDSTDDTNEILVQPFERTIKLMMDFKIGVEFKEIHGNVLAVNDQA